MLGHWETYDFGLELQTALAKALDEVSTSLIPQIITGERNELFHFEWDNNEQNNNKHSWLKCSKLYRWDHNTGGETRI